VAHERFHEDATGGAGARAGPPRVLRVVVADDHPLFRAGIVRALREDPRFEVVGEAGDGAAAERAIRERAPDLALLDLRMPGLDGIELLSRLRDDEPSVAVVVLTAYTDARLIHRAMAAGAAGYAAKDRDREDILGLLCEVAVGRRRVLVAGASADAAAITAAEEWGSRS
jgi:two-component system nitrate/nitrite response regulator NarL